MAYAMIRTDGYGSERRDPDTGETLIINHTRSKSGDRHYLKVSRSDTSFDADGLAVPVTASVSISFATPVLPNDNLNPGVMFSNLIRVLAPGAVFADGLERIVTNFES